ncbi:MAG: DUF6261 family protein [Bacteroidota bacterium]
MVNSANLRSYRLNEFIQFVRNTLLITSQHNPTQLKIKTQYNELNKIFQRLEQAYKQDNTSDINAELAQLDTQRDQAIICLRMISEGYMRHPDEALQLAGKEVNTCINKYGTRLYNLNYSAETSALKNIARDLQTIPECMQAIEAMHLGDVVNEMKRVNQEFEKLFIQRLRESSETEGQSTKELVQFTTEAYRTLIKHVEAHDTLTPSAEYTLFISHLNENIEHFNEIVDRRKSSQETEGSLIA